jgi:hypothetical protein
VLYSEIEDGGVREAREKRAQVVRFTRGRDKLESLILAVVLMNLTMILMILMNPTMILMIILQ